MSRYVPGEAIVSHAPLQLADCSEEHVRRVIDEFTEKCDADDPRVRFASARATPQGRSDRHVGRQLLGQLVLEVPVQDSAVPSWVLRCAADRAVLLRDTAGTELNDGGIGAGADGWSAVTADVRDADHWTEGVPRDRRPTLAANVARGHGVRVVVLDERGSRTRAIDYDWREGRLWRWIDTLFSYPDGARRYRMDQAVEVTTALFEPDGDGRVEIRDKVASPRDMDVLTVEDAPVQGFWLDWPPFGEWGDLLNPRYGVPERPPGHRPRLGPLME